MQVIFLNETFKRMTVKQVDDLTELVANSSLRKNSIATIIRELQYRKPTMPTSYALIGETDFYYRCPRCQGILDREYVSYCNCCGQALAWRGIKKAVLCRR
jgi:hypothetical protein